MKETEYKAGAENKEEPKGVSKVLLLYRGGIACKNYKKWAKIDGNFSILDNCLDFYFCKSTEDFKGLFRR